MKRLATLVFSLVLLLVAVALLRHWTASAGGRSAATAPIRRGALLAPGRGAVF